MKFIVLFCSVLISLTLNAQSNEGTEFWLTFMEHVDLTDANQVVMITSRTNTSGEVKVPGIGFSQNFIVAENDVVLVSIPSNAQYIGSEEIRRLGVQVTSNSPVSVYIHQYSQARSEAALILPVDALSNSYYTMSYTGINSANNNLSGVSELSIVGIEDDTEISFTLSDNSQNGIIKGTTNTIILDEGEVYQIRSENSDSDLTGSYLIGTEPFAVFSGASWCAIPRECRLNDNIVEQMPPIGSWGTEFISTPTVISENDYDIFRILASENSTSVTIENTNGMIEEKSLDQGEYYEFRSGFANYISSTKPVIVAQYLIGSQCTERENGDPAMLILNAVEQIRDTITMFSSSLEDISENYISIISTERDKENVTLDGNPVVDWSDFGGYAYTIVAVNSGAHTIASAGCGVIASAFGLGEPESYAYGGGASFLKINEPPLPDGGCLGSTVVFDSELPPERYDIIWNIGDNVPLMTEHQFEHVYSDLGVYPAEVIIYDNCFDKRDTFYKELYITLRQTVNVGDDNSLCFGEDIFLEAFDTGIDIPPNGNISYIWEGPENFFEETEETFLIKPNARPEASGYYRVSAIVSGCKSFSDSILVVVNEEVLPNLGEDFIYCSDQEDLNLDLSPGIFDTYKWQDGSTFDTYKVTSEGDFHVTVYDDFGCEANDSLTILDQCPTYIYMPNIFRLDSPFGNDKFGIVGKDITSSVLSVYDRWGNRVYQSDDYNDTWDGRLNGSPVSQGVYVYTIEYEGFDNRLMPVSGLISGSVTFIW